MCAAEAPTATPHQVLLAHQQLIDEQYFFEDPKDARWFWTDGYKERLYLDNEGAPMPYDRMALWIGAQRGLDAGDQQTARRGVIGILGNLERNKKYARQSCLPLWAEDRLTQHKRRRAV